MNNRFISWGIFLLLCLIWGSSFILMKWGLYDSHQQPVLSAYEVAALRLLSSGLVMLPFLPKALKTLPKKIILYILLTGWLGSFFPSFLFCIAETRVDSALAGSLNSLTPLFVIITAALFYRSKTSKKNTLGVIIGLLGCALLVFVNQTGQVGNILFSGFVILATFLFGLNVNMIYKKLDGVSSLHITTIAFTGLIPPSIIILLITGYFKLPLSNHAFALSTLASSLLGIVATAMASWLLYILIKKAGGLFASLVTYGVPFIAILWGIYYGEKITFLHVLSLLIILAGVYLASIPEKAEGKINVTATS